MTREETIELVDATLIADAIREDVRTAVAANPGSDLDAARSIYAAANDARRRLLALNGLLVIIAKFKRDEQLKVERAHFTPAPPDIRVQRDREYEERRRQDEAARQQYDAKCAETYDFPERMYGNQGSIWMRAGERKEFRRWCDKNGKNFEDWKQRCRAVVADEKRDWFEADWHPRGMHAYYAEEEQKRMLAACWAMLDHQAKQIRLEITAEFLKTEFALGDGVKTTWGEATKDQHQQRLDLLMGNVAGNMATAARHKKVILILDERQVSCLAEVPPAAVDDAAADVA